MRGRNRGQIIVHGTADGPAGLLLTPTKRLVKLVVTAGKLTTDNYT